MPQRLAIVTTLRNAAPVLDSFIRYHRAVGFDHLFLFFDDPDDPALHTAQCYAGVTAIPNDERLHRRWKSSTLYETRFAASEVMARQGLNFEVALHLAQEQGIDWLLHIDHDELFFAPHQSVRAHFAALTVRNVQGISYANYEAVPEQIDLDDFFKEVTLFKWANQARDPRPVWTEQQQALLTTIPQIPPKYFHFYTNGKSAARVQPGLRPNGVHKFTLPHGRLALAGPGDPLILHYPCCGFEAFWNKFVTLEHVYADGVETWWGQDITQHVSPFYLDARDVVRRRDRQRARAFYQARYVIADPAQVEALIEHDVCRRILAPARLLSDPVDDAM